MKTHLQFYNEVDELLGKQLGDQAFADRLALRIAALSSFGVSPEIDEAKLTEAARPAPILPPPVRGFKFGKTSLERIDSGPMKPELAAVFKLAITLSTQDFTMLEVRRTHERQRKLLAEGATRTLKSKHLVQPDGFVWAGDAGAWNNGTVTWGFDDYYEIVQAMDEAATRLGYAEHVRWGGIWDMVVADYGGITPSLYKEAIEAYKIRHKGPDFLDGPHFEWVA